MSLDKILLFQEAAEPIEILSEDGRALYYPSIFDTFTAKRIFKNLESKIQWKNDEVVIFGKHHIMRRKSAWYGSEEFGYTYSKIERTAKLWIPELLEIKEEIEKLDSVSYNSCLLNYYYDGADGMGWHSDDEKELDPSMPIASLSFGSERKFGFKKKSGGKSIDLNLENGSLLTMYPPIQEYWKHSLKKSKRVMQPRINLTFRVFRG